MGEADEFEFAVVEAEAVVVGDQAVKGVLGLDAALALDVDDLKDCIGLSLCKQVDVVLVEQTELSLDDAKVILSTVKESDVRVTRRHLQILLFVVNHRFNCAWEMTDQHALLTSQHHCALSKVQ